VSCGELRLAAVKRPREAQGARSTQLRCGKHTSSAPSAPSDVDEARATRFPPRSHPQAPRGHRPDTQQHGTDATGPDALSGPSYSTSSPPPVTSTAPRGHRPDTQQHGPDATGPDAHDASHATHTHANQRTNRRDALTRTRATSRHLRGGARFLSAGARAEARVWGPYAFWRAIQK
jgi:hypothetical protein